METTVTIGPYEPIVLFTPPTYQDLVVKQKWWMSQVARENQVTKFVRMRMLQ